MLRVPHMIVQLVDQGDLSLTILKKRFKHRKFIMTTNNDALNIRNLNIKKVDLC